MTVLHVRQPSVYCHCSAKGNQQAENASPDSLFTFADTFTGNECPFFFFRSLFNSQRHNTHWACSATKRAKTGRRVTTKRHAFCLQNKMKVAAARHSSEGAPQTRMVQCITRLRLEKRPLRQVALCMQNNGEGASLLQRESGFSDKRRSKDPRRRISRQYSLLPPCRATAF